MPSLSFLQPPAPFETGTIVITPSGATVQVIATYSGETTVRWPSSGEVASFRNAHLSRVPGGKKMNETDPIATSTKRRR